MGGRAANLASLSSPVLMRSKSITRTLLSITRGHGVRLGVLHYYYTSTVKGDDFVIPTTEYEALTA